MPLKSVGTFAQRPSPPNVGDEYTATDTVISYKCYATGTWTSDASPSSTTGSGTGNTIALWTGVGATTTLGNSVLTVTGTNATLTYTPTVSTSGSPTILTIIGPAHTTLTAAEVVDVNFALNRTVQFTTGATIAIQRAALFQAPTYSATAATQTLTDAGTVVIGGAPIAGANVAITRPWSFWIQSGSVRFDTTTVHVASNADFRAAVGDANPVIRVSPTSGLLMGAGGASALDLLIARSAASVLTINNNAGGGTANFGLVTGSLYYESSTGAAAAVSGAATGRIRYNNTTGKWQISVQTGAYVDILTAAAGSIAYIQGGNSFGAAGDLGTNDGFALNIRTTGTTRWVLPTASFDFIQQGAGTLRNTADNALTIGTATQRVVSISAIQHNVFAASGDANASAQLSTGAVILGVGGATALDSRIRRTAAATLTIDNNAGGGALSLSAVTGALFYESADGAAAPVSGAATGRIRYNNTTGKWQTSVQTGPYLDFLTAPTGSIGWLQGGNSFGATGVLGTNDAFDVNIETGGIVRLVVPNSAPEIQGVAGLILTGGTAASNNLTLRSTTNATKGTIFIGGDTTSNYDETNHNLIIANFANPVQTPGGSARLELQSSGPGGLIITVYDDGNNPFYNGQRARGSQAAPGGLLAGDTLMTFGGTGHNGTTLLTFSRASIRMKASENWSATANGARIEFHVTPNGSTTFNEQMRLDQNGFVSIGGFAPSFLFHTQSAIDPASHVADGYGTGVRPMFIGRFARGTPGIPTAIQTDDILTGLSGRGYGATAFSSDERGSVLIRASQVWTDTAHGTYVTVRTTPNGTITIADIWKFDQNGDFLMMTNANLAPNTDNQGNVGTAAKRFATSSFVTSNWYATVSDANAAVQVNTTGVRFGAGGASALDTRFARTSASALTIDNNAGGGAIVHSAVTGALFIESADGAAAAVSGAATGRLRYNNTAGFWQISVQAGAYQNIATVAVGGGTLAFVQGGNSFGAAANLGTNDAFDLNIETNGTARLVFTQGTFNMITQGAGTFRSTADNQLTIGTATQRCVDMVSILHRVFAASADANASAQLSTGAVILGVGGATALDTRIRRTAATTLTIDNNSTGAATVVPATDNQNILGTAALRWATTNTVTANFVNAVSDANPTVRVDVGGVYFGAGAGSALDTRIRRTGTSTLTIDNNSTGAATIVPATTNTGVIGTDALKWNRIRATTVVTGDLEMQDEERNAHWVLREETDRIVAYNKITGKKYEMSMKEIK